MSQDQHLRDVAELVAANTKLSEVLAESQREVVAKVGAMSADDTAKLREACHKQRVVNWALMAFIVIGAWFSYQKLTWAVDNSNQAVREALEAGVAAKMAEARINAVEAKQKAINETVYKRLNAQDEEILNGTRRP